MTNNVTRADVNVVARPQPCAFTSSRHGLLLYAYTQEESSGNHTAGVAMPLGFSSEPLQMVERQFPCCMELARGQPSTLTACRTP